MNDSIIYWNIPGIRYLYSSLSWENKYFPLNQASRIVELGYGPIVIFSTEYDEGHYGIANISHKLSTFRADYECITFDSNSKWEKLKPVMSSNGEFSCPLKMNSMFFVGKITEAIFEEETRANQIDWIYIAILAFGGSVFLIIVISLIRKRIIVQKKRAREVEMRVQDSELEEIGETIEIEGAEVEGHEETELTKRSSGLI